MPLVNIHSPNADNFDTGTMGWLFNMRSDVKTASNLDPSNVGVVAAEAPTPTYDVATGKSTVGSSPRARRSLDMGGGRRAGAMLPDYEGDGDHFVLPASAI